MALYCREGNGFVCDDVGFNWDGRVLYWFERL